MSSQSCTCLRVFTSKYPPRILFLDVVCLPFLSFLLFPLQRMLLRGFLPNPVMHNTLPSPSTPAGLRSRASEAVEKAEALVEEMQSNGMATPDVYLTVLLLGCTRAPAVPERATLAYQRMRARGLEPDLHVYSAMIALYARQQMFEEVEGLYGALKERRLKPDATYSDVHARDVPPPGAHRGGCGQSRRRSRCEPLIHWIGVALAQCFCAECVCDTRMPSR